MRLIVTAGPTLEPIDEIRCITNFSSGKTGYEIAKCAVERGHEVILVSGPVNLPVPDAMQFIPICTSSDLLRVLREHFPLCDGIIMAAAVCDYRPKSVVQGKIKKQSAGITLELEETEDILASIAVDKENRIVAGFALESEDGICNALDKCRRKNCDFVLLNPPSSLCGDGTEITIVRPDGTVKPLPATTKADVAALILLEIENMYNASLQGRR